MGIGTAIVYDERMLKHSDPKIDQNTDFDFDFDHHPEQPMRIKEIYNRWVEVGLVERCTLLPVDDLVSLSILEKAHDLVHLDFMANLELAEVEDLISVGKTMDSLYLNRHTNESAIVAATGTVNLAMAIYEGRAKNGFALVRPPGHHAERDRARGFCFYNNVAIAARCLQVRDPQVKILILDWDIHHGNGTQNIFKDDPNVLFISIHRHEYGTFYPIGPESCFAAPNCINVAWNGFAPGDADYLHVFYRILLPVAGEFNPDFVLVSAGFDAAEGDPLGGCHVTPAGFAQMTHLLMGLARGNLLLTLEGGYNVSVISDCAEACLRVLLGEAPPPLAQTFSFPSLGADEAVNTTIAAQRPFWKCLLPKIYNVDISPSLISLQAITDIYWKHFCQNSLGFIPLPDQILFDGVAHVSGNILTKESSKPIVVFAHEGGTFISSSLNSTNIADGEQSCYFEPWKVILQQAVAEGWLILDICTKTMQWKLKQTFLGHDKEVSALNSLMDYIWEYFLKISESEEIFFVASGLCAYAICNLLGKIDLDRIKGVFIISPTQYLPVMSVERATWYQEHSKVLVPSKKLKGTAIACAPTFGSCFSSGDVDVNAHSWTVQNSEILQFILGRL